MTDFSKFKKIKKAEKPKLTEGRKIDFNKIKKATTDNVYDAGELAGVGRQQKGGKQTFYREEGDIAQTFALGNKEGAFKKVLEVAPLKESNLNSRFNAEVRAQENSRGVNSGWDKTKGLWFPHTSAEGGADTVGYGHKIKEGEDFSSGLTEQEAIDLYNKDMEEHRSKAKKTVPNFDEYEEKYQLIWSELAFNLKDFNGKDWVKLAKAMKSGNDGDVRHEMNRTYTNKEGKVISLSRRVKALADVLGLPEERETKKL
tara:strand:- start:69 stop:839 length:771 start_codon:yes stop_codon:yes gene_type:complete